MRFVRIVTPGGPEVLLPTTGPDPERAPGEVLVQVTAAGVNNADLLQRAGHYPPPPGAPDWPGLEISGTVLAADAGSGWSPGDAVVGLLAGGGYADRVVVPAAQLLPVPDGVDLVAAAALPEALCTVWSTFEAARLSPGEWVLVHGGSGGIGTIALQVAAALGARVVTTAGGPERAQRCLELGAVAAIDHRGEDFVARTREVTAGHGADVVLDVVGAAYLARNLEVLATGGRLAVIGMQKGRRAELDLGLLLTRRATVLGTTLRSRPASEKAAIVAGVREHLWPLVADGRIRPVVHATVPLERAGDAHAELAAGGVFGKLLLVP
ncbi:MULTISPECIES: NAD(P)H-quinone oxidoreductase [unclassified Actinotalea]|uniref:NAD(P)H-quinone oxidoreductase n=1 Tax=unclassified Actinotalea TaxID=2638618 RepID=UPI0015F6D9A7|nr:MULTISPECIES: NAD(P)H-quinone oxidoreductase [unclassified Actinotalea]